MTDITPPRWADRILRLLREPQHRESFSGDLLEEYRESIHPARGRRRAQRWYVRQVGALAWRQNRVWGLLLGASFVGRTAVDWLMPTTQFQVRSMVLTALSVAILLGAGFWAVRRSKSLGAGALGGLATVVVAGLVDAVGAMLLLALSHDPQTLDAIRQSGGLGEVFALPWLVAGPGIAFASLGGLAGRAAAGSAPSRR